MPKTVKGIINHPVTPPLLIFLSAFGLRLALIITTRDFPLFQIPIMDMLYHDEWARRIAGGDFWGNEVFFRAPLYPYFLAALYAVSGGSITFARIVQAVIGGGSTVACYFVGLELFKNRKIAFTGAALLATIWTAVYFDVELLLVVLEVFFDLLAVLFLLKARDGRVRNFILAGLFVGMSAITRPNILAFALFVWLIYLVARPRLDKKKLIKGLITFYIAVIIVILPVTLRNYVVGDDVVLISSQGGVNLYIGNNPKADGTSAIVPGTRPDWWGGYYDAIYIAESSEGRELKPSEINNFYIGKTVSFFKNYPLEAAKLFLRKLHIYTVGLEMGNNFDNNFLKHRLPLLKYDPISLYIILPFTYLGIAALIPGFRGYSAAYVFMLIYSATVILFFVNDKFRMPVVPFFCLFAAAGFFWLWGKFRSREWKPFAIALPALVALFIYCAIPPKIYSRDAYFVQAGNTISWLYVKQERYEEAEKEILKALEIDPENAKTLVRLGDFYFEIGRKDEAVGLFEKSFSLNPDDFHVVNSLGRYYAEEGEYEKAYDYFERSLEIHPRNGSTLYFLAATYEAEGRRDEARETLRLALEYEPTFKAGLALLGELSEKSSDLDEAETAYGTLLELNPSDPIAALGLAQVKHKKGEYFAAELYYKRYLDAFTSTETDVPVVHYNLACCLALQGKKEEALDELEKAVESDPELYSRHAADDPDFESLRGHERFERLTTR